MLIPIFPMFQYHPEAHSATTEVLISTAEPDMLMTLDECDRLATEAVLSSRVSHIYKAAWDIAKQAFRANVDEQTQRAVLLNLATFTYDVLPMTQMQANIWAVGYGEHLNSFQIEQVANYGLVFPRCLATLDRDTETHAFLDSVTHSYMRLLACTPEIIEVMGGV